MREGEGGVHKSQIELRRKREQLEQQLRSHQIMLKLRQQQRTDLPSGPPVGLREKQTHHDVAMAAERSPSKADATQEIARSVDEQTSQDKLKQVSTNKDATYSASARSEKPSAEYRSKAVLKAVSGPQTLADAKTPESSARDASPARKQGDTTASSRKSPIAQLQNESKTIVVAHFMKLAPLMKMFQGVDDRLIERLSTCLTVLLCEGDDTCIVEAGTEGHSMFFLIKGECGVFVNGKRISTLTAPCTFGEIALLLSERRSADVRTSGYANLCACSQRKIVQMEACEF